MTITRTNLQPNPTSDPIATLATIVANGTLARVTTLAWLGEACSQVTSSAAGPVGCSTMQGTAGIPVVPGRTYTSSFYVRPSVTRAVASCILWSDAAGAVISLSTPTYTAATGSTYSRRSTTQVAPAGAAYAAQYLAVQNAGAAGETYRADGFLFEDSATLDAYFDGDTATSGFTDYRWLGTASQSASVQDVHATTWTAVTVPDKGAVTVTLDDAPWDWSLVDVTRSVDGGPAVSVRLVPEQDIGTLVFGEYVCTDYDVPAAAAGLPITYTLTTTTGAPLTTAPVVFTPGPTVLPWTWPELVQPLALITGYRHTRRTTSTVHDVIGVADPAVTVTDGRPATGSVELWCATLADALALEALLMLDTQAAGDVFLLRGPVGDPLRVFFTPTEAEVGPAWTERAGGARWSVRVGFVTRPTQTSPRGGGGVI